MSELQAKPGPVDVAFSSAALVVIDMQNAFVTKGAMLDLFGVDVSHIAEVIEPINKAARLIRAAGAKVIWVATVNEEDGSDTPGPDSGVWCKDTALCLYRDHPEWKENLTFRSSWGAELAEGLDYQPEDVVFKKKRTSAFYETGFDSLLKELGVRYLLFAGVATNICVEATLRDSYHLGYYPVLLSDATACAGPPFTQQATEFNVMAVYGWVASTEEVRLALE
jgi:ureidoacrylate peracid hydrolase